MTTLRERYDHYNRTVFDNALPSNFDIEFGEQIGPKYGCVNYNISWPGNMLKRHDGSDWLYL